MYRKKGLVFLLFVFAVNVFGDSGLEIIVEDNSTGLTIIKSAGAAKTLVIPETINGKNVTVIGNGAFTNKGLIEVTIPDSVVTIGDGAFSFNSLTVVNIGNSVTTIGTGAFTFNKLVDVTLGNSVANIGKGAFSNNLLTKVIIPDSVVSIDDYAFFSNNITSIDIPVNVTLIGEGAFSGNKLASIEIGQGVTSVRDGAFYNNKITSVTIPPSLETMGKRVFDIRTDGRIRGNINYTDTSGNVLYTTANNFDTFYASSGRKPGKYVYLEGSWSLE